MLLFLDIRSLRTQWQFEYYLLGLKTICLGCWASADPHTQPSSYPQNWDHLGPRHEKVACSPLQCLQVEQSERQFTFKITSLKTKCKILTNDQHIKYIKVYKKGFMLWHRSFVLNLLSSAAEGQNRDMRLLCRGVNQYLKCS